VGGRKNAVVVKIDWQFTTVDASIKLKRLYPQMGQGKRTKRVTGES
jgi:hypothetical protein